MSEPDAVPLPRDGAVFFDVRGESRSMRLSWYADSAVAVFSIWQGNRCTGTFRLPFGDLVRMVETLQSGPPSHAPNITARQPGGTTFAGHQQAYPETASHQVRGYPDHAGYEARGPAGRPYSDAPGHLAAERPSGPGDPPGYSDRSYPGPAYGDRYPGPVGYQDHHQAAGYSGRQQGGPNPQRPTDYQGALDYRGTAEHHGAAEHMDPAVYREPGGYTDPGGYQNPGGYTDPGGHTDPGVYHNSADYPDSAGYAVPGGYPDPRGYLDRPSYQDPSGLQYADRPGQDARRGAHGHQLHVSGPAGGSYETSRPFEAGRPAAEFSEPVAAAGWLAAPTAERPAGRHGADPTADTGIPGSHSVPARGDQSDSDWEAATAAYRSL